MCLCGDIIAFTVFLVVIIIVVVGVVIIIIGVVIIVVIVIIVVVFHLSKLYMLPFQTEISSLLVCFCSFDSSCPKLEKIIFYRKCLYCIVLTQKIFCTLNGMYLDITVVEQ